MAAIGPPDMRARSAVDEAYKEIWSRRHVGALRRSDGIEAISNEAAIHSPAVTWDACALTRTLPQVLVEPRGPDLRPTMARKVEHGGPTG